MRTHSKKILLSLAAIGTAGAIAGLGTFATFTSTTSATHSNTSGTVAIALGATGAVSNRLNIAATNLVAGDTIQRTVDLISTSSEGLGSVALTSTAPTTSVLDTPASADTLQMVIDECSVPWTESGTSPQYTYTCTPGATSVLATGAVLRSGATLSGLSVLTAAGTDHLRITLTLPSSAPNGLQTKTSVIDYTFLATQRAATNR